MYTAVTDEPDSDAGCKIRETGTHRRKTYVPEGSKHSGHAEQHTTQPLPGEAHGTLGWQAHCAYQCHTQLEFLDSSIQEDVKRDNLSLLERLRHRRTGEIQRPYETWILKKHPG